MWNNQPGFSSYGGNEGQGGYMSPGGFGTPQADERKGRNRAQNVVPVTIAEIINSTQTDDNKFYSGDMEIYHVTFVGIVRTVSETNTRIDYEIDDNTAPPLEVKQFVDNDESIQEEERTPVMRENTYVRVRGTVRTFGGKKSVVALKMLPITDMNEMSYHLLDVIHSHATANTNTGGGGGVTTGGMTTMTNTGGYGDNNDDNVQGLTSIQNQVRIAIKNNASQEGADVDSVCKQIRGVPEKIIREAIEFLSGEGHIYSTVDDDHFKATDS